MGNKHNPSSVLMSTDCRHLKHVKFDWKHQNLDHTWIHSKSLQVFKKKKKTTCRTSDGALECIYACLHAGKNRACEFLKNSPTVCLDQINILELCSSPICLGVPRFGMQIKTALRYSFFAMVTNRGVGPIFIFVC